MGNFLYGGKRPTNITYQEKDVQTLKYNGVTVWSKLVTQAHSHTATWKGRDDALEEFKDMLYLPPGVDVCCVRFFRGDVSNHFENYPTEQYVIKVKDPQFIVFRFDREIIKLDRLYSISVNMTLYSKRADHSMQAHDLSYTIYSKQDHLGDPVFSMRVDIIFGPYWNEHDFSDNTSDHKHLDWTK